MLFSVCPLKKPRLRPAFFPSFCPQSRVSVVMNFSQLATLLTAARYILFKGGLVPVPFFLVPSPCATSLWVLVLLTLSKLGQRSPLLEADPRFLGNSIRKAFINRSRLAWWVSHSSSWYHTAPLGITKGMFCKSSERVFGKSWPRSILCAVLIGPRGKCKAFAHPWTSSVGNFAESDIFTTFGFPPAVCYKPLITWYRCFHLLLCCKPGGCPLLHHRQASLKQWTKVIHQCEALSPWQCLDHTCCSSQTSRWLEKCLIYGLALEKNAENCKPFLSLRVMQVQA